MDYWCGHLDLLRGRAIPKAYNIPYLTARLAGMGRDLLPIGYPYVIAMDCIRFWGRNRYKWDKNMIRFSCFVS